MGNISSAKIIPFKRKVNAKDCYQPFGRDLGLLKKVMPDGQVLYAFCFKAKSGKIRREGYTSLKECIDELRYMRRFYSRNREIREALKNESNDN